MRNCVLIAAATVLLSLPAALHSQTPARTSVGDGWVVEGADRAAHAKIAPYLGREALWLRAGTQAMRSGVQMADGTIEFDLAPMKEGDFAAVMFRRQGAINHENIYLRLSRSGEFMATQYAPRMNGSSTWQLYPEFTGKTDWPREQWTHVRIELRGSKMQLFAGAGATPVLSVDRLRHESGAGEVGFWALVNDKPQEWAAAVANVVIRPEGQAAPRATATAPAAGIVPAWQVAGTATAAAPGAAVQVPADLAWSSVPTEESGLVNLNRRFRAEPGKRKTAYARATVTSDAARRVRLGVGYSDDVTVFLNGEAIYSGVNGWNSRYAAFVGFVDPRQETVVLPLRAGDNDLLLAVTDDQFFGWGFSARLDPQAGVTVR